jgi:single-stranded-DNA-specific exonuclease
MPAGFLRRQSVLEKKWIIAAPHADRQRLSNEARLSPLMAQLLLNRGIANSADARGFLSPEFRSLHHPEALPNAVAAARKLLEAARCGRRIVIYGDYDVDGITASAILWHALRLLGANVDYYIPSRHEEGYGLNADALTRLAADGRRLSGHYRRLRGHRGRRGAAGARARARADHHRPPRAGE